MFNMMSAHRRKRAEGDRGFTLIELLVVVVIIGILIAIAIPLYLNYKKGANDKAAQSDVRNTISVLEVCNSDNSTYPTAMTLTGTLANGQVASFTGCTGQKANFSANTTMTYTPIAGPPAGYSLVGTNSGGSGKYYCYNSTNGGSVRDVSSPTVNTMALAVAAC